MLRSGLLAALRRLPRLLLPLASLLLLALPQSAHAFARHPEDFPLEVHVYSRRVHSDSHFGAYYGEGKANLVDGSHINAIDFAYRCGFRLQDNDKGESYPARWLKPGLKLQILTGIYGSATATRVCDFDVAVKDFVYDKEHGSVVQYSQAEYATRRHAQFEHDQALAPIDLDPSHYPLEFALLHLSWTSSLDGVQIGSGQGNLRTATGTNAVDFSIHCPVKLQATPNGRYLVAKWVEPGSRMLLLLRPIDVDGAPGATCQLITAVEPDVYIRSGSTVKAISQEEYAKRNPPPVP